MAGVDAVSDCAVWPPFSGCDVTLPSPLLDVSPSPSAETKARLMQHALSGKTLKVRTEMCSNSQLAIRADSKHHNAFFTFGHTIKGRQWS